jgi:acetylornithine deacetylase
MSTPSLIEMISQLVGTPSVSSTMPSRDMGNRPVIDALANWLEPLGFDVKVMPLKTQPHKANLIARLGTGTGGLVLAGHTDTVPCDDALWQSDPFALTERDNRLYGLGSADMKGFFAIAIEAIKPLLDSKLKAPVIILATADEESSMDGARALVKDDLLGARYAIVGEPTGLKPIYAHKGIMMESIVIEGRSGHSSNPLLGNNAMEAMHEVITELLTLRGELQAKYQHPGFAYPTPTLNLGCIHGGDNPNRICGRCELHFDLRTIPGMGNEEMREKISAKLREVALRRQINIGINALMPGIDAFEQPLHSELVTGVQELTKTEPATVSFCTEAPFFQKLGLQTLVMGPGHIDQAHQPDEFMPLEHIKPSIALLQQLIKRYCLA